MVSASPATLSGRAFFIMVAAMASTFTISQAYRTVPAVTAGQIASDFGLDQQQIGLFAASFHLAFALMQIVIGVSLDRYGARRTLCWFFSLTILGSAVSALAPNYAVLMAGQVIIGFGCAPALVACLFFMSRHLAPERISAVSGMVMSLGGVGTLLTATPLAWVVEVSSWRFGFAALTLLSAISVAACLILVERDPPLPPGPRESVGTSFRNLWSVLTQRQAAAILILGAITYAVVMSVRSLWLVPLFTQRYGFSLVDAGNVVLLMSLAMIVGPALFGRLDPGPKHRRKVIVLLGVVMAVLTALLGLSPEGRPLIATALSIALALEGGFVILQYSDVRAAYPPEQQGRALSGLTMSMFFGVAVLQWTSGLVAGVAESFGGDPVIAAFLYLAAVTLAGVAAFALLPGPATYEGVPQG